MTFDLRLAPLAIATGLALATAAQAASGLPPLARLQPVDVARGANPVPRITPDGRDGLIVRGFRSYMTADGSHDVFMVLTRAAARETGWNVVTVGAHPADEPDDPATIEDAPHTGEDQVRSVRFARAEVAGRPAFLMLVAARAMEGSIPAASHVAVSVYTLERDPEADGDTFVLRDQATTGRCYGNADLALQAELGLPLPPDYAGPKTAAPCGSD